MAAKDFMIDPDTYLVDADLSRADLRVLLELCGGQHIAEYGIGGSTAYLAQIASSILAYEPDMNWIRMVRRRLAMLTDEERRRVSLRRFNGFGRAVPPRRPVHFVDAKFGLRGPWIARAVKNPTTRIIIIHDSRREELYEELAKEDWSMVLRFESVDYHYRDSNMLVIRLRESAVKHENWNKTEPFNRLPHLHKKQGTR